VEKRCCECEMWRVSSACRSSPREGVGICQIWKAMCSAEGSSRTGATFRPIMESPAACIRGISPAQWQTHAGQAGFGRVSSSNPAENCSGGYVSEN